MTRLAARHARACRRHATHGSAARRVWLLVAALLVAGSRTSAAQDVEVPVDVQVPLFHKVMTFDRRHDAGKPLVFAIVFQSGNRASASAKERVLRALEALAPAAQPIRAVAVDLDREPLADALARHRPAVLYVTPLRAFAIEDVATASRAARVTSFTGVPRFVLLGLAVGVRLQGDRPRLMINLQAARAEGADFSAELLKLAHVIP